ncbi:unnamed protein product [Rotaria sp. Silwood1]|nr:unnamed protein product [Rotaria sp. Silwood1]CAF1620537.1 unnamed protein product [Rotaria sp. Silwood1]
MTHEYVICLLDKLLNQFEERYRYNIQLFQRYNRQLTYEYLEQNQEFVWYAHNGYDSGRFHDMSIDSNLMIIWIKCQKTNMCISL